MIAELNSSDNEACLVALLVVPGLEFFSKSFRCSSILFSRFRPVSPTYTLSHILQFTWYTTPHSFQGSTLSFGRTRSFLGVVRGQEVACANPMFSEYRHNFL